MCGIAGFVAGPTGKSTAVPLRRMADTLRHRGPNDEGYLTVDMEGRVALWSGVDTPASLQLQPLPSTAFPAQMGFAHRRLSILDLSSAGHQPMGSPSGRYWIVLNGEIYNYRELRVQLQHAGHTFRTETDTEILLAGFEEWGMNVLPRLEGMFAFAILDRHANTLLLARDPFGIKPLYYAMAHDGSFVFASEMKALLGVPGVSAAMHAPLMFEFLRYGVSDHGPRTMFADIHQLPGGHTVIVEAGAGKTPVPTRYWALPNRTSQFRSFTEAAHAVRNVLEQSVRMHLRSDVPVGSCLSGGLDSTAIVALALPMLPANNLFHTVSFVSSDPLFSEAPFVELAKDRLSILSEPVVLTSDDVVKDIERLVWTQDIPFGSLSIYAQYGVFRAAQAQGLTVMLDGQGSDELFGGYNTAVSAATAERIAHGQFMRAIRLVRAFSPLGVNAYKRTLLSAAGRFLSPRLSSVFLEAVGEPVVPKWLDANWFADRQTSLAIRPQGRGRNALDQELRLFTECLSLPQLLRYEDRNSMAFSIESRVPFCDVNVATVAMQIPTDMLVTDLGETKAVLRAAMRGVVPDPIIDRPKIGFAAPDRQWIASVQELLVNVVEENAERLPFLCKQTFLVAFRQATASNGYFSPAIWRVLNTIIWARMFNVEVP